jgi:hypothetical protein
VIAVSPGGRNVSAIFYGEAEPHLRGKANFNSAAGGRDLDAYFKRGERKRPVLFMVAGIHGQEMEAMVGTLSLIKLMETGSDILGRENPSLLEKLRSLRIVIIPMANPDGRARVPYDGWVGLPSPEMSRYGHGTDTKGERFTYPKCKTFHPMKDNIGIMGAYYDDNGVNMMHDEWSCPMSETTKAILKLVSDEGPDIALNLHGHGNDPGLLPVYYVPVSAKWKTQALADDFYTRVKQTGFPCRELNMIVEDGDREGKIIPSLNFTSMMYHVGANVSVTYESPQGFTNQNTSYHYTDMMNIFHILMDTTADFILKI